MIETAALTAITIQLNLTAPSRIAIDNLSARQMCPVYSAYSPVSITLPSTIQVISQQIQLVAVSADGGIQADGVSLIKTRKNIGLRGKMVRRKATLFS